MLPSKAWSFVISRTSLCQSESQKLNVIFHVKRTLSTVRYQRFTGVNSSKLTNLLNVKRGRINALCQQRTLSFQPVSDALDSKIKESKIEFNINVDQPARSSVTPENLDLTSFFSEPASTVSLDVAEATASLTAKAAGLTTGLPPSWIFNGLQYFHDILPWWGAIAVATLCARIIIFPLIVRQQKLTGEFAEAVPKVYQLQQEIIAAQEKGDFAESEIKDMQMKQMMEKSNFNPLKLFMFPMVNGITFSSFFFAIRAMANYPVTSMKTEGILWFTDLTVPDPIYILPLVTSSTMFIIFKLGIEFGSEVNPEMANLMKVCTYVLPPLTFLFMINFPSALGVYWCTNNFISLTQSLVLRNAKVRESFGLKPFNMPPPTTVLKDENFKKGLKKSWDAVVLSKKIQEKRALEKKIQPIKSSKK